MSDRRVESIEYRREREMSRRDRKELLFGDDPDFMDCRSCRGEGFRRVRGREVICKKCSGDGFIDREKNQLSKAEYDLLRTIHNEWRN